MSDWKESASPCIEWPCESELTHCEVIGIWHDHRMSAGAWRSESQFGWKLFPCKVKFKLLPLPPQKKPQKVTRRMAPRIGGCESFGEGEGAWKLHRNLFKSQFSLILPSQDAHLTHTPHLHPIPTYMPTHCSSNTPYFCSSNSFFILLILTWHSPRI